MLTWNGFYMIKVLKNYSAKPERREKCKNAGEKSLAYQNTALYNLTTTSL